MRRASKPISNASLSTARVAHLCRTRWRLTSRVTGFTWRAVLRSATCLTTTSSHEFPPWSLPCLLLSLLAHPGRRCGWLHKSHCSIHQGCCFKPSVAQPIACWFHALLLQADGLVDPADAAPAGFYGTNAYNTWTNNAASGGFFSYSLPALSTPLGDYRDWRWFNPSARPLLQFDNNIAHSSGFDWCAAIICPVLAVVHCSGTRKWHPS